MLREEPTAAQSFLSDLKGSKDPLFCLLLFSCFGPVHSEAIILYCFYLPGTAEGESKCIYGMDQILPPLTCRSKHPEDSSISTWRQSWSWSRTQRVVNQQMPRAGKGPTLELCLNFRCWIKHNIILLFQTMRHVDLKRSRFLPKVLWCRNRFQNNKSPFINKYINAFLLLLSSWIVLSYDFEFSIALQDSTIEWSGFSG